MFTPGSLEDVAQRWIDALNRGDLQALEALVSEDVVDHSGLIRLHGFGREGLKRLIVELKNLIPDWTSAIDELVVRDGRFVTIRYTGTGSVPPPFLGRPRPASLQSDRPTPKMSIQMVSTIRIENGRIVEHWARSVP